MKKLLLELDEMQSNFPEKIIAITSVISGITSIRSSGFVLANFIVLFF